jgi:hypothetical protein
LRRSLLLLHRSPLHLRSLLKIAVLVLHGGDGERRSPPI